MALAHAQTDSTVHNHGCTCNYCRRKQELLEHLTVEETERIVSERVEARVAEVIASNTVQQSVQERLMRERTLLEEQVGRHEQLPDAGRCITSPLQAELWPLAGVVSRAQPLLSSAGGDGACAGAGSSRG